MTDIYGYAAAAPLYRAAGWMQVIPLPEGRKTPPPSGFTGRSRKPVTDEQVRFWSQATPDANTGIVIPEGVLVLDIDAAQGHQVKADGAKGISELSQELGMLPATWSSTAHGIDSPARHLFYKVPEGLAWKGGAIEESTSCNPATGIPWSGRRSTRAAKCTAGTRQAAHSPARSPISATWRHCHGSGWTTCANPTECRIRPL